jgi:hypothetical protein
MRAAPVLDRAVEKGARFMLSTPRDEVRAGSFLEKEIRYLLDHAYVWDEYGRQLIKK